MTIMEQVNLDLLLKQHFNMKPNQDQGISIKILQSLEPKIRELTRNPKIWETLDVDYFPPRVERLYTTFEGFRIYLHLIHKTSVECLYHKHRWAAAFKQLSGSYEMGLTYSPNEITSEYAHSIPDIAKFILEKGSYYEMTQTDAMHYVQPISDKSWSLMITKDLYPEAVFRKETLDKKLKKLSKKRKEDLLAVFDLLLM